MDDTEAPHAPSADSVVVRAAIPHQPEQETRHELRIVVAVPLPADSLAQAKIVAGLEGHIESFKEAVTNADRHTRFDVGVIRTKPRAAA